MSQFEHDQLATLAKAATSCIEAGQIEQALGHLLGGLNQFPDHPSLNTQVSILFDALGNTDLSLFFASRAVLLGSSDTSMLDRLAKLFEASGDPCGARAISSIMSSSPPKSQRGGASESRIESGAAERREPAHGYSGSWADCGAYLELGAGVFLGPQSSCEVRYRPNAPSKCISIGDDTLFFGALSILRQGASIQIGKRCRVSSQIIIAAHRIQIGDDVLIEAGVTLMDNDSHSLIWEERQNDVIQCGKDWQAHPNDFIRNKDWAYVSVGTIVIHDKAWVGFNSTILKGVTIGEGAVVMPGSVVIRDVPSFIVVGGNPATIIRHLSHEVAANV